jgi:hypothetical protein
MRNENVYAVIVKWVSLTSSAHDSFNLDYGKERKVLFGHLGMTS